MLEHTINTGLQKGDKQTYEFLFRNYYGSLCSYALRYLERKDLAEEVVAETFFRIWVKRKELHINGSVKAYLFQAVYNNSLAYLRKQKNEKKLVENLQQDHLSCYNNRLLEDFSERDSLILKELDEKIKNAIQKLPDQAQRVFTLKRYEGLKNKEVAEQLQISLKTVEMHMTRSLLFLRTELKDYLPAFLLSLLFE